VVSRGDEPELEGRRHRCTLSRAAPPIELPSLPLGRPAGPALAVGHAHAVLLGHRGGVVDVAPGRDGRADALVDDLGDLEDPLATVGAGLLVCGVFTVVSALVLVIVALGLPPWAAALAVGVLLTLGGAVAIHVGVDMVRHVRLHFPETRDAITEGMSWLKGLQR